MGMKRWSRELQFRRVCAVSVHSFWLLVGGGRGEVRSELGGRGHQIQCTLFSERSHDGEKTKQDEREGEDEAVDDSRSSYSMSTTRL